MMLSLDQKEIESKMNFKVVVILFCLSIGISILSFNQYSQLIPGVYELKYLLFFCFLFGLIYLFRNSLIVLSIKSLMLLIVLTISMIPSTFYTDIQSLMSSILLIVLSTTVAFTAMFIFPKISKNNFVKLLNIILFLIIFMVIIPNFLLSFSKTNYYIIGSRIRFIGNFNNSNELARFSALGFLISIRIMPEIKRKVSKLILLVLMGVAIYIVYISDSRGALLLCGISILIMTFNWSYLKISKRGTLFIMIIVILPLMLIGLYKIVVKYSVIDIYTIDQLLSGRLNIWCNVLKERSVMQLIFGSGTERSNLVASLVLTNGYIELLMYFGILGLFQWMSFIIYLLYNKIKSAIRHNSISSFNGIAIIIAFLIYYIFEGGLISVGNIASIYFWLELSQTKV